LPYYFSIIERENGKITGSWFCEFLKLKYNDTLHKVISFIAVSQWIRAKRNLHTKSKILEIILPPNRGPIKTKTHSLQRTSSNYLFY